MDEAVKELKRLDAWAETLLASLAPRERQKLLRRMGVHLRRANSKRITRQVDANGRRWKPRKKQEGKVAQKRKMLLGFRKARHMKVKATSDSVSVGFSGNAGRIARIHHFGLRDRLSAPKGAKGPLVKFAERKLLGLSIKDRDALQDMLTTHIDPKGLAS